MGPSPSVLSCLFLRNITFLHLSFFFLFQRNRVEKRSAECHTPEDYGIKRQVTAGRSPRMTFSPASFSPTV